MIIFLQHNRTSSVWYIRPPACQLSTHAIKWKGNGYSRVCYQQEDAGQQLFFTYEQRKCIPDWILADLSAQHPEGFQVNVDGYYIRLKHLSENYLQGYTISGSIKNASLLCRDAFSQTLKY